MSNEMNKRIAFDMAKAILETRSNVNIGGIISDEHTRKINDVAYWVDVYKQCLQEIEKST